MSENFDRGHLSLNYEIGENIARGRSPVPLDFFTKTASKILFKLWGPRLFPGGTETLDENDQKTLEDIFRQIPDHYLVCLVSWQFETNPNKEASWDFYKFTFHQSLVLESRNVFEEVGYLWNKNSEAKLSIKEIKELWEANISAIGLAIENGLSKKYSGCVCKVKQPHSYVDLERSVKELKALDKDERSERAKHIVIASKALRVFDMIEEDFGASEHPLWQDHRQAVNDALNELQDGEGLPNDMKAQLEAILEYQRMEALSGLIVALKIHD